MIVTSSVCFCIIKEVIVICFKSDTSGYWDPEACLEAKISKPPNKHNRQQRQQQNKNKKQQQPPQQQAKVATIQRLGAVPFAALNKGHEYHVTVSGKGERANELFVRQAAQQFAYDRLCAELTAYAHQQRSLSFYEQSQCTANKMLVALHDAKWHRVVRYSIQADGPAGPVRQAKWLCIDSGLMLDVTGAQRPRRMVKCFLPLELVPPFAARIRLNRVYNYQVDEWLMSSFLERNASGNANALPVMRMHIADVATKTYPVTHNVNLFNAHFDQYKSLNKLLYTRWINASGASLLQQHQSYVAYWPIAPINTVVAATATTTKFNTYKKVTTGQDNASNANMNITLKK